MNGQQLKEIREKLGMTQDDFGKLFGYHQSQIRVSEFERNVRKIPRRVIAGCTYLLEKSKNGFVPKTLANEALR